MSLKDIAPTNPHEPSFLKGLTVLQKNFVRALFEQPSAAAAARTAGYQGKDAGSFAEIAYQLSMNDKVRSAVTEMAKRRMRDPVQAVKTVENIMVGGEKDADRLKAAKMILDRADAVVAKSEQTVNVVVDRDKSRRDSIKFMHSRGATREQLISDWGEWAVNEALPLDVVEGEFTVIEAKPEEPKPAEPKPLEDWMT